MKVTSGTDTEVFLKSSDQIISAIPLISGTKEFPISLENGGNLSHDNVTLEFATPIANDENEFLEVIKSTIRCSFKNLPIKCSFEFKPSHIFNFESLNCEEAWKFGCDIDYDAWRLKANKIIIPQKLKTLRSAGGHLHIGGDYSCLHSNLGKIQLVRILDCLLSPTIISRWDIGKESLLRRKLYGKAGCHRPTKYGIEYRVLSNFWIISPKLVRLVYNIAMDALRIVENGRYIDVISSLGGEMNAERIIRKIIEAGDFQSADEIHYKIIPFLSKKSIELLFLNNVSFEEWGLNL